MDQSQSVKKFHRPLIGVPLVILATFFNAAMAVMVKLIKVEYQLPNQLLVFARFFVSFIALLPILFLVPKYRPLKKTLKIKIAFPYLIRSLFGLLTIYAYFYAIEHISLTNAVLLTYTSPLFIPLVVWVWKGVILRPSLWWALGIGFLGVACILGEKWSFSLGYLIGILAGICAAISYVAARLQSLSENPVCVNFYFFLISSAATILFTIRPLIEYIPQLPAKAWFMLSLMGIFGALFQGLIILALKWAHVRFIGAFLYLAVPFAMGFNWLIFNRSPNLLTILGICFVFTGIILMIYLDPQKKHLHEESPSA